MVDLAWKNGDPGIVFIDRINADNPTPHIGEIESTNPCGEQPLLPYESCNLGSINLSKVVPDGHIDYGRLGGIVRTAVRFLDDVIDVNRYPLPEIEHMTKGNRKIGLGVMGFADMLLQLEVPYDSEESCRIAGEVMGFIHDEARAASEDLAARARRLPQLRRLHLRHPGGRAGAQRHGHHHRPHRHHQHHRRLLQRHRAALRHQLRARQRARRRPHGRGAPLLRAGGQAARLLQRRPHEEDRRGRLRPHLDGVPRDVQRVFVTAHDITPEWHIKLQAAFQKGTDNAVSKTVNFPNEATIEDVEKVYLLAYRSGCKGVTIYRDGSREEQVLNVGQTKKKRETAPGVGIATTRPSRPQLLSGETQRMETGCGKLFVIMNDDEYGPREVFANMGKAGGCASSNTEALGRLISLALKKGASAEEVTEQLKGIRCHAPYGLGPNATLSCADAIGKALERRYVKGAAAAAAGTPEPQLSLVELAQGACPDCGSVMRHEGGCLVCTDPGCSFSKCS